MTLPTIRLPATLPVWQLDGYASQESPMFAHVPMQTGHSRTRPIYTASERTETASLRLTAAQLAIWHAWHEDTLLAGVMPFACPVAAPGTGVQWYEALVLSYSYTPEPGDVHVIECRLLLRGQPSTVGP